ncbi:MAG: helix-turn-helix domain-containing protein [Thiolinea sp.]
MTDKTTDTAKDADPVEIETAAAEPVVIDDTVISPGSLSRKLRGCREMAELSLEQAAQEMRLPINVLKALESENFAALPEPPYVRGYLRSYARLSETDPNDLIRRYEILRGADPDDVTSFSPSAMPMNRNTPKPTVSPGTIKLAGLAFVVFILGVLSMIPAVSQWATETWKSFSAQNQATTPVAATELAQGEAADDSDAAGEGKTFDGTIERDGSRAAAADGDESAATAAEPDAAGADRAASSRDTAAAGTEQLALNTQNQAVGESSVASPETMAEERTSEAAQPGTPATTADNSVERAEQAEAVAADADQTEAVLIVKTSWLLAMQLTQLRLTPIRIRRHRKTRPLQKISAAGQAAATDSAADTSRAAEQAGADDAEKARQAAEAERARLKKLPNKRQLLKPRRHKPGSSRPGNNSRLLRVMTVFSNPLTATYKFAWISCRNAGCRSRTVRAKPFIPH